MRFPRTCKFDRAAPRNSSASAPPHVAGELLCQAQDYLNYREKGEPPPDAVERAWHEFYRLSSLQIRQFACRCGTAHNDIGDCTQDVWAELVARLPRFELDASRGQFESWLFSIVQSKSVDLRRLRARALLYEGAEALLALSCAWAGADHLEDRETAEFLWNLLRDRLPEESLEVLRLRLVEQLSGPEVAVKLGLTHDQVRHRYARARHELASVAAWLSGPEPAGTGPTVKL